MTRDLERALAHKTKEAQVLRDLAAQLGSTIDLDRVLDTILETMEGVFGCFKSSIYLLDDSGRRLRAAARRGGQLTVFGPELAMDDPALGGALEKKRIVREHGDLLILPLFAGDKTVGAFIVEGPHETDETLLTGMASYAAAAINTACLYRQLSELNSTLEEKVSARTAELKNTQARLLETQKMAALVRLVAGITHEMNSPLGTLVSSTHTIDRAVSKLQGDAVPSTALLGALSDSSRAVAHASGRIDSIVRRMKSFVRLDEAVEQEVQIETCLEDALALLGPRLERISVVRDYAETQALLCYPARLNDVFSTLLRNACDAVDDRPSDAQIVVRTRGRKPNGIQIEIDDNGVGMSEDEIEHIFDPAFSSRGPRVRMGLGLVIAYQVVHDHGGEIHFESQLGYGTTVSIDLPGIKLQTPNAANTLRTNS